jgi:transposase-like protein
MDRRSSLSEAQRVLAVGLFERGLGPGAAARQLVVAHGPVKVLYQRWRIWGRGALLTRPTKRSYSFEFKLAVVERFLAGEPVTVLAAEYELSSPQLVKGWVRVYRREGADGLRPKPKGRPRKDLDGLDVAAEPESELVRLRRENERLRAENAYLGKLRALRQQQRR